MRREEVAIVVRYRVWARFAPMVDRLVARSVSGTAARTSLDTRKALAFDWYLHLIMSIAVPFVVTAAALATLALVTLVIPGNHNWWELLIVALLFAAGSVFSVDGAAKRVRELRAIVDGGVVVTGRIVRVDRSETRQGGVSYTFFVEYVHGERSYTVQTLAVKAGPELVGPTPAVLLDVGKPGLGLIRDLYV